MAGFLTSVSASLTTGTKLITISGNVDCSFVVSGTAVYLNNILMEGVSGTSPDPSGNSTITLRNNYTGSSIVDGTLVSFNTIEGLRDAIQRARELAATQVTNNEQLELFLTTAGGLIDLELPSGTTQVVPYKLVSELTLANDIKQYAMSQAQFDAIREQNKERYAASGWVNFGNHESGKQVNECKSGLYTALTTPNTLLIGESGGVGGSKTDYASVHIDGVVFNLTNQFVLTLPSHPTSALPERMDMYGVESEKVEISAVAPNAYQGGLRGVGAAVNLFSATEQQKKDFFAQNSNTAYIGSDGKIYQWQLYRVSFAGTTDGVPSPTEQGYTLNSFGDLWLKDGKNLLYFGNALRLNDGGYHPSFNPLGAAKFVGDTFWYNTATSITSRADCFNPVKLLAGSGSIASGKSGRPEVGGRYYDAIYTDGYGGVCRDMRYSAYRFIADDSAEADQRVKNMAYRGFENVTFSRFHQNAFIGYFSAENSNHAFIYNGPNGSGGSLDFYGSTWGLMAGLIAYQPATGLVAYGTLSDTNGAIRVSRLSTNKGVQYSHVQGTLGSSTSLPWYFVDSRDLNYFIGGASLQTDVIAPPEIILANPALANGWQGSWGGFPLNDKDKNKLSRKCLLSSAEVVAITNSSGTANYTTWPVIEPYNTMANWLPLDYLYIVQYQAFATQTEPAANGDVYGKDSGIGKVFQNSFYGLSTFQETLIGKVATGLFGGDSLIVTKYNLDGGIKLHTDPSAIPRHISIDLPAPANNSVGVKALNYNVNINHQAFIQYAYTELKHNGTNWGDDGKQAIFDNQSTKTDLNGNTVLVGTAKLKEPIGWIKNKV